MRVLGQSAKIRQARWGHCQKKQILEHRAPTQALGDAQSIEECLFGPYRVAVKGLKRGLLVSRECSLRLRVCPILARLIAPKGHMCLA
jgi:hypothetical protein